MSVAAATTRQVTACRSEICNRLAGIFILLPGLPQIADYLTVLQPNLAKLTAQFDIGFNVALAVAFIGPLDPLAWLLTRMFPARTKADDPSAPRYLDDGDLSTPPLALADQTE